MRIYFSGRQSDSVKAKSMPENLLLEREFNAPLLFRPSRNQRQDAGSARTSNRQERESNRKPCVMMSFHYWPEPSETARVGYYVKRMNGDKKQPYIESLFMDSGAHSLFNLHAKKAGQVVMGKHGRELHVDPNRVNKFDFSFFSLKSGSEYRKYCDRYASFMKKFGDTGMLFVSVDVIKNPELTWETQQYFEKEHGLFPVPVVHAGEPVKWVSRYVETGNYDLIGLGGLGQNFNKTEYIKWADQIFTYLCPESNKHKPIVRVHGFAMTAWGLLVRWPWWSVDSASWLKMAAFGGIYVPPFSQGKWRYDKPPLKINLSFKSPSMSQFDAHISSAKVSMKELVTRWLVYCEVPMGTVDAKGEMIEWGAISHYAARFTLNLHYMKDLEESRPAWPYPLDKTVVDNTRITYQRGFR